MSYYDPYEDFESYDPSMDPYANMAQGDPMQAMMIQMMMGGQGFEDINAPAFSPAQMQSMVGMVPQYQPSGKPLTVSNQTSALNAYSNLLFDPAMMGFGGTDVYSPESFQPTTSTQMVESPELQQIYGYLRSPTSLEGMIAKEMMEGGTPGTAARKLRQLLTADDAAIAEQLQLDPAEVPTFKANLLMEMPMIEGLPGAPGMERSLENIDEDALNGIARDIGEQWAKLPLVGPTGPQYDPNTGALLSQGGERMWSTDETGAPVMVEVNTQESPLADKYRQLGLSSPFDEYTAEDFMAPEQVAMRQAYLDMDPAIAEAKAAWMDPSLRPTSDETMTPYNPDYAPGGGGGGEGGDGGQGDGWGNTGWRGSSLWDVMTENPSGDTSGIWGSITRQGLWDIITGNEGDGGGGGGQQTRQEDQPAGPAGTVTRGGSTIGVGPSGGIEATLPGAEYSSTLSLGGGMPGHAVEGFQMSPQMQARYAQFLAGQGGGDGGPIGPPAPGRDQPGPFPPNYPRDASGYNFIQSPDDINTILGILGQQSQLPPYAQPGAQQTNQPGGPAYMDQYNSQLPPYAQPGAQQANQPGGPAYMDQYRPQAPAPQDYGSDPATYEEFLAQQQPRITAGGQTVTQEWSPNWTLEGPPPQPPYNPLAAQEPVPTRIAANGQPVYQEWNPYWQQGGVAPDQPAEPRITAGGQTVTQEWNPYWMQGGPPPVDQLPPWAREGASPARQPGDASYIAEMETGERRAREQRERDEAGASILGGTTDRTGKRVRPTRTGEQARQYRAAFQEWDRLTDEQFRMKQAAHNYQSGQAMAQARNLQDQGVNPLQQQLMARRLVLMGQGMPSRGYMPGT